MEDALVDQKPSDRPRKPGPRVSSVDWVAARRRFIDSTEVMTYEQLGDEIGVTGARVGQVANAEGWSMLRAKKLDAMLRTNDAQIALLAAAKTDGVLMQKFGNVATDMLDQIAACLQAVQSKKVAPNTRMNTINTASFALGNLARALKEVGVVGLPKVLKDAAGEANGRWNPQMLTALNVTVQNLMQPPKPADGQETAKPVDVATTEDGDPDVV